MLLDTKKMSAQSEHACARGGHYSACTLLFKSLKCDANFHQQGASDPNVMGIVESGSFGPFIWCLANWNHAYSYGYMGGQENSGWGAQGGAAAVLHYNSKIPIYIYIWKHSLLMFFLILCSYLWTFFSTF